MIRLGELSDIDDRIVHGFRSSYNLGVKGISLRIGFVWENRGPNSSIIAKGILLKSTMQFFPLLAVFVGGEILDMISNTGAVAKLVLLALLAFSLISWAIILTKWSLLRRARMQSGRFRARLSQGAAVAGHRRRGGPVSSPAR